MVDSCVLRITLLVSCSVVSAIASEVTICSYQDGALKRRAEHWREVPLPDQVLKSLELVHGLRSLSAGRAGEPHWPWSRTTGHRRIAAIIERAGIVGPQTCPKGLRHAFGIAAVAAGVPLPTIAALLGHADISTTAIYTTAVGIEARAFVARMWSVAA